MSDISSHDRAKGAIIGTLIGDALGVGPHWYYDLDEMKEVYGEWIDEYTAPMPDRYHAGLQPGEVSQTGQVVTFLVESLAGREAYDPADFTARVDALLDTLDGTAESGRFTDQAMRDVWKQRKEDGRGWSETGSLADTGEAAIRAPVLAARYYKDIPTLKEHLVSNLRLTHIDPFILGQSVGFGMVVAALIRGIPFAKVTGTVKLWDKTKASMGFESPEFPHAPAGHFFDAILQPGWAYESAHDPSITIEPASAVCKLYGLACTLGFMLPAAYYLAARFETDFEMAILSAINGGGNNMGRAALTGALSGAMNGFSGIPERFVSGLHDSKRLVEMADEIAGKA